MVTYRTMCASCDRSSRWAASTADTMAPSKADRSQNSSLARNFRARLKNAAGPLEALTAMTCRGDEPSLETEDEAVASVADGMMVDGRED
jgi:hypothetical protein